MDILLVAVSVVAVLGEAHHRHARAGRDHLSRSRDRGPELRLGKFGFERVVFVQADGCVQDIVFPP